MRSFNDLVRMLRRLILDIDELKTTQFVGTNQIKAKYFEKLGAYDLQFRVTAPYQTQGSSHKTIRLTVMPKNMPASNILLADVAAEITYTNGARLSAWDQTAKNINYNALYSIIPIDSINARQNEYLIRIIAPTNTVLRIKLGIMANAETDFVLQELN